MSPLICLRSLYDIATRDQDRLETSHFIQSDDNVMHHSNALAMPVNDDNQSEQINRNEARISRGWNLIVLEVGLRWWYSLCYGTCTTHTRQAREFVSIC